MNKATFAVFLVLLMPAVSSADEKTLYNISENMFTLAESTLSCAASGSECAEGDIISLRADAKNGLNELVRLVVLGNVHGLSLTVDQIRSLGSRAKMLQNQLVHIEMFEQSCNLGLYLLDRAPGLILYGIMDLFGIIDLGNMPGLAYIASGIALIPVSCLLLLSCLFWWL